MTTRLDVADTAARGLRHRSPVPRPRPWPSRLAAVASLMPASNSNSGALPTGSTADSPTTRSGGSSGSSCTRDSTSPTPTRVTGEARLPDGLGGPRRGVLRPGRRWAPTRPTSRLAACRTGCTPGVASPTPPTSNGLRPRPRPSDWPTRIAADADAPERQPHGATQPPHARALCAVDRRALAARPRLRPGSFRARPSWAAT